MDWVTLTMYGGFVIIILATLWNILVAPKDKKKPSTLFAHFIKHYGFSANESQTLCTGVYAKRTVQLSTTPFQATLMVSNPKGILLTIEQDVTTLHPNLIETPVPGGESMSIHSNFPALAAQMLDNNILERLAAYHPLMIMLDKQLTIILYDQNPKLVEDLIELGSMIAQGLDAITYAY